MKLPLYQVDAFHRGPFTGNPAAVCPLEAPLDPALMQAIAAQNNLSETAFVMPRPDGHWDLRWFTPRVEVDLCGHATLATAHVLTRHRHAPAGDLRFHTRSGPLSAQAHGRDRYQLDFPARDLVPLPSLDELGERLDLEIVDGAAATDDWLLELADESAVAAYQPDFTALGRLPARGVIVTARGSEVDFVSRFFGPRVGVDEDPVTGSAHCSLAPYWASRLGRDALSAWQLSRRGGAIECVLQGGRVLLSGACRTWLEGTAWCPG